MKCGNDSCKFYLAGSCTSSRVFLDPLACKLMHLDINCVDCKLSKEDKCVYCTKEWKDKK